MTVQLCKTIFIHCRFQVFKFSSSESKCVKYVFSMTSLEFFKVTKNYKFC
jgi:hypothetical protein